MHGTGDEGSVRIIAGRRLRHYHTLARETCRAPRVLLDGSLALLVLSRSGSVGGGVRHTILLLVDRRLERCACRPATLLRRPPARRHAADVAPRTARVGHGRHISFFGFPSTSSWVEVFSSLLDGGGLSTSSSTDVWHFLCTEPVNQPVESSSVFVKAWSRTWTVRTPLRMVGPRHQSEVRYGLDVGKNCPSATEREKSVGRQRTQLTAISSTQQETKTEDACATEYSEHATVYVTVWHDTPEVFLL